ncbi:Gypsy retrotransposon integrase-like protein 1 [Elysia marginata]|uniref:Gypsy retrotransposon integrase-like protein 1 n=1 Tax=Elysia marginata TaxID=1093978 RepID=A0AAV4I9S5_9GAST|nr:Gypsy retrotransposon integrase-like protein 1 [Elysia marginata]
MDACPEDLATSLREKDLPTLERIAKEADLFLQARHRKLCDQPRRVFQNNARPKMDPVRLIEPEKKLNSGQRTGEARVGVADQRLCFKCKKTGHIARYCTAVDTTVKKAGAGVVFKATEVKTAAVKKPTEGSTMKVTDNLQKQVKDGMLQLASGKSVPVMMNCAALSDPEKTKSLRLPILREDPRIQELVDADRTSRRGGKVVSFEKARGIVYRRYEDPRRNVSIKQVVLPKSLREYVMSVAHDSLTGAHLGIRRTKDKVLSNFYWPGVDGDVTRYCRSCDVCQRTVKKGIVPRVPFEKVPLVDTPFKRVAMDIVGPINPPSEAGHRFIPTLIDYATRYAEAAGMCTGASARFVVFSGATFSQNHQESLGTTSSYSWND